MPETKKKPARRSDPVPCWAAKPCPFCGWVPNIQPWHGGAPTKVMIACDANCSVAPRVTGETRRSALARWNRRAPASPREATNG